jgi:hypothetical protein
MSALFNLFKTKSGLYATMVSNFNSFYTLYNSDTHAQYALQGRLGLDTVGRAGGPQFDTLLQKFQQYIDSPPQPNQSQLWIRLIPQLWDMKHGSSPLYQYDDNMPIEKKWAAVRSSMAAYKERLLEEQISDTAKANAGKTSSVSASTALLHEMRQLLQH